MQIKPYLDNLDRVQVSRYFILIFMVFAPYLAQAQSVGLVLSGGGAKGLSHVGAIKALEENNIPIDYIAGTSMGAIVAGLYSIGISPEEMIFMFRSKEFNSWYQGQFEDGYATYVYRRPPTANILSVNLTRTSSDDDEKSKFALSLPTNLISPYPMDLAVMQIFASSAAVADYNFDNLMVPFFCIASDIANKRPVSLRTGDLGSAIRASMTYPFLFKPISIDSTLLFDGGFYNNFPWDIMLKDFNPDVIIGVKCASNNSVPDPENIVSQIENMLTIDTNYAIPEEVGFLIDSKFTDISVMDFHKIDELVQVGYENTLQYIPQIKERIGREVSEQEILDKRLTFRRKTRELVFDSIYVHGNLRDNEKRFIERTIKNNSDSIVSFDQVKRGFYRVIATGNINTLYPQAMATQDSTFALHLNASKAAPFKIYLGGNVSSSSLNQGVVGLEYHRFSSSPWTFATDLNLGRFYSGFNAYLRQDIGIKPLWFYEAQFNLHRFDYFASGQSQFFANRLPSNIQESELYATIGLGTPLNFEKDILGKINLTFGSGLYEYYNTDDYDTDDTPNKTRIRYISPSYTTTRNTTNYPIYPTEGVDRKLVLRYAYLSGKHTPGKTENNPNPIESTNTTYNIFSAKFHLENYFSLLKSLALGVTTDVIISSPDMNGSTDWNFGDYNSTLLTLPAFQPSPHSKTIFMKENRASSYIGLSVTPIIKFSNSISLHTQISYFQPYRRIYEGGNGEVLYTKSFPTGNFMGNFALVWHSPIGDIALSASYYDKSQVKWYPQLNIGYMLFKPKGLDN
jgi:Predicted esterase of the alpha-beta hydrolase superfamily